MWYPPIPVWLHRVNSLTYQLDISKWHDHLTPIISPISCTSRKQGLFIVVLIGPQVLVAPFLCTVVCSQVKGASLLNTCFVQEVRLSWTKCVLRGLTPFKRWSAVSNQNVWFLRNIVFFCVFLFVLLLIEIYSFALYCIWVFFVFKSLISGCENITLIEDDFLLR